ncbi:uncharacterized protein LOC110973519 [Acanthaster planci]|uniref:Uncharacterized protein LOC110973519 n=1 Tax=Acanthaster planci TaxID=133434 RepID=A0A8B7XJG7_ACAPL|nr:uncharacterized protein LOC110973519 [Acanthaster planci]
MSNERPHSSSRPAEAVNPLPMGAHSPIPNDPEPYAGDRLQYCYVNIEAVLKADSNIFSSSMVTTNTDACYPVICQPYTHGFILQQFQACPGLMRKINGSSKVAMPFQAILSKPVNVPPSRERCQLRVEKSFLKTQGTEGQTVTSNTSDIHQKISNVAAQGGRLICIEITGFEKSPGILQQALTGFQASKGVDLFFHMPLDPNPTRYVYQAVSIPIKFKMKYPSFSTEVEYEMETDFMGHFAGFLQRGWKLVEINYDNSIKERSSFLSSTIHANHNSIWFLEKEASKVSSDVPEWEGTIIEYEHKVKFGVFDYSVKQKTDWIPLLNEMGHRGWELACMVESPETYEVSYTVSAIKVVMFFQRRIIRPVGAWSSDVPPQSGENPPEENEPPHKAKHPSPMGSGLPFQGSNRIPQKTNPMPHGRSPMPQGSDSVLQGSNPITQGSNPVPQGRNPVPQGTNPVPQGSNPVTQGSNSPLQRSNPVPHGSNPVPQWSNPVLQGSNPVPLGSNPMPQGRNPVSQGRNLISHGPNPLPQRSNPMPQWINPLLQRSNPIPKWSNPLPQRNNPMPQWSNPVALKE